MGGFGVGVVNGVTSAVAGTGAGGILAGTLWKDKDEDASEDESAKADRVKAKL